MGGGDCLDKDLTSGGRGVEILSREGRKVIEEEKEEYVYW